MQVLLTPLREEHASTSFQWRNNLKVWEFTENRPTRIITPEIEHAWIVEVIQRPNEKRFAILVDSVYVGNVQLTSITDADAEFHIFIGDTNYWGKGIATQATQQLLNIAFAQLGLKTVYLQVKQNNLAAIRAYEKVGFRRLTHEGCHIKMVITNTENVISK
jgi:RimJ/RimL family protein N-acetyltransferase